MDELVVGLDTARRLKAAGFPQKAEFYWVVIMSTGYHLSWYPNGELPDVLEERGNCIAAPTAQEIADQLPEYVEVGRFENGWYAKQAKTATAPDTAELGDTMAEALAALYLKLREAQQ